MADTVKVSPSGHVTYFCPGCRDTHTIDPTRWKWDGNRTHPTFSPSVLVTCGCHSPHHKSGDHCWCTYDKENPVPSGFSCYRCHSFVKGGMVELLADCSHENAGKTMPLMAFEEPKR